MSYVEPIAGYIGGACGIFCTHPLDIVRIRAQVFASHATKKQLTYGDIAREIMRSHGPLGFFRGVLPPVILRGLTMGINRWAYSFADKNCYAKDPYTRSLLVGGFSGGTLGFFETPIHLLKNRAQTMANKVQFSESLVGYVRLGRQMVVEEGLRSLGCGMSASIWFGVGSYALFYLFYDSMMAAGYNSFVCGMASAFLSWPVFYPLDVVRTRQQAKSMRTVWSRKFFTFSRTCRDLSSETFPRWFPGLQLTLVRAVPRWGIVMSVHEHTKNFLNARLSLRD